MTIQRFYFFLIQISKNWVFIFVTIWLDHKLFLDIALIYGEFAAEVLGPGWLKDLVMALEHVSFIGVVELAHYLNC